MTAPGTAAHSGSAPEHPPDERTLGAAAARPTVRALVAYFLGLGTWGFGGPVVLVERMRRDLQECRGWVSVAEYTEGLALAQIAPGPLAAQLAIYLGWARGAAAGATLVGLAFVAPSFLMVLALSAAYVRFGGLAWMQGAFYGVGAAVIALIAHSAWRLVRRTAGADRLLWAVVLANAVMTAWTGTEVVWVIAASGLLVLVARTRPRWSRTTAASVIPAWLLTGASGEAPFGTLGTLAAYFAKAGAVVFGSGLAIIPYLHGGTVQQMHWLSERQFLDAVAVSMITPGPVVITVAFIGYLVAGPLGACAAALGVFFPTYLFVVGLARGFQRVARNRQLRAAVDGVTAAATGAIAGAAVVLGQRALVDGSTWVIFALAVAAVLLARRVPEPVIVLAAAVVGVALRGGLS